MIIDTERDKELIKNLFNNKYLVEIIKQIEKYFCESKLSIEWIKDPDGYDDGILVSIMFDYKSEEDLNNAINTLYKFEDEWWIDQIEDGYRPFSIDIEPA